MSILSGFLKTKKYRKTANGYKLQSEWTSSQTVQMDDGNTLQNNLGAIKGITSSLTSTNSSYALSAAAGKNLQEQLNNVIKYTIVPTDYVTDKEKTKNDVKAYSFGKIGFITGTVIPSQKGDLVLFTVQGMKPLTACAGIGSELSTSSPQANCTISIKTTSISFNIIKERVPYRFLCVFPID